MAVASEVKAVGFRPGIVNLRKFEHRKGNSLSRNSLNFRDSVDVLYAGMNSSLAHVDNTRQETAPKSHKNPRVDMSQQLQATLKNLKELSQQEAMVEGQELASWAFLAKGGDVRMGGFWGESG